MPETCAPGPCPAKGWATKCEADPSAPFRPAYAYVAQRGDVAGAGDEVPRDSDEALATSPTYTLPHTEHPCSESAEWDLAGERAAAWAREEEVG